MTESDPHSPRIARRRFVQLLAALPLVSGYALAQPLSTLSSEVTNMTTQRTIKPKALVFDMQGTVLDFYDPMMDALTQTSSFASHLAEWSTFAVAWSAAAHDAIVEIAAGRKRWQSNGAVYADVLPPLLSRYPGRLALSADDKARLLAVWSNMKPWADSATGLAELKKSFTIATLTNASMAAMITLVKREKLPFDAVLTGELVHAFKPDACVYQLASDYLGFASGEVMLVSAHKWDLRAAKHNGLLTAFVPRLYENGPFTTIDTSPETFINISAPDLEVV
ncbi:MAG: hypothetical protein CPDRYMAC_4848 [uncultured Paraburkholderia sp.]|nr:MAG: hypothetical protein CPDRYDRY_4807 [uncultured Paraburkholderia sp.]CAH2938550.1 MAG: hypothetical protein CPDRYMAC_4848 [uncultured Paraburkholderia sp.]